MRHLRRKVATFTVTLLTGVTVTLAAQAQVSSTAPASPTTTLGTTLQNLTSSLTTILAGPEISTTEVPLTNSFQPTTPWPPVADISETAIHAPHDLLAYTGVMDAARQVLDTDYATWEDHFAEGKETSILPQGLLMSSGCLNPCDSNKSLLIVNPTTRRVYAAMVARNKVVMRPSLMSWPDEAIPALKRWLADATDDSSKK